MAKTINISDSVSLIPSGYEDNSGFTTSTNNSYAVSNGYTNTNSTTSARLQLSTSTTGSLYYTFNDPQIPSNATIDNITAAVRVCVNNVSRVTNTGVRLYSGSTPKGSSSTFSTTSTTNIVNLTTGTWTAAETQDIRLYVTGTGSSSSQNKYVYFYGAEIEITYSVNGTAYTITAVSSTTDATITPATQDIIEGENASVQIDCADINDFTVLDNDIDITSLLTRHNVETGGSIIGPVTNATLDGSLSSGSNYYNYPVGYTAENPHTYSSNMYASSGNTATIIYDFDFSDIPNNATIESVEVRVYGKRESTTTDSTHMAKIGLYSGSTLKGAEEEFTSTTAGLVTINNPGTWTRAELQEAQLQFTVAYYGGQLHGISFEVTYSTPNTGNPYYWTYELTNINNDHIISIDTAGVYIPPEEDPQYEYQSLTISSINATTNPGTGTTRVIEGSNQIITISPTDPQLTLALDNGVDITNQLVGGIPTNTYTVTTQVSGASYGFNLNSSTGYYVSTNNGVSQSASVARLNMDFESSCIVTIQYINYAEENYDYGMFGKLDTAVATDGLTASSGTSTPSDSTSNYQLAMASNSANAQTISYTVPAGEHFIDIKYGKDNSSDSNNDSLQWKVLSIEATSAGGDYTYTLTNITQKHSLVFVFGNVNYYFITSSGTNCRLFPDGQQVKLEGESYKINIIPDNITDTVSLTDNNVNQVLTKEEGVDKNNNPAVSYNYTITNIQAAHTLVVSSTPSTQLFIKSQNSWVPVIKLYLKQDNRWIEQDITYLSDNNLKYLKRGN